MSWLFGFIGPHLSPENAGRFQALHPTPRVAFHSSTTYFAAGGLPETCLHGAFSNQQRDAGWAVTGVGLERSGHNCRFLNEADWQQILSATSPPLKKLDGHFVAVKWKAETIECFTDQLGLRALFFTSLDGGTVFSTRLDWLAKLRRQNEVDFAACGSSWLTFNQIGYEAFLKNLRRLGPNGFVSLSPASVQFHHAPWTPASSHGDHDFVEILEVFLNPAASERVISLGLSGGLDSRTLLALLASQKRAEFSLHVFGLHDDPDVRLSRTIASQENLPQDYFDDPIPESATCMQLLHDYAAQTQFIEPASTLLKLRYGTELNNRKKIIFDGGFGEIARRQFLNRFLFRGKTALQSGNPRLIYPYLRVQRPPIFIPEILQTMRQGVEEQIAALWREMPAIQEIGAENFLDLLAIRTRLPNAYGFEQGRLDGECLSFMPFAQPSFLRRLFQTPVARRKNGRLFRQLIRQRFPRLSRYPLVKGGTTYPFDFSTVPAWAWTKLKTQLGQTFTDPSAADLLHKIAAEVQDLANSASVKSYAAYDYLFIRNLVEKFFRGQTELAGSICWWLAFELWRQAVNA
jgi:hypothetical protein